MSETLQVGNVDRTGTVAPLGESRPGGVVAAAGAAALVVAGGLVAYGAYGDPSPEVAAYRIVMEALTNVARHASARACTVRFSLNGALELDVADDGRGLPPDAPAGVGITAMRERAAELGGTLRVDSGTAGTRIVARLPTWEHA